MEQSLSIYIFRASRLGGGDYEDDFTDTDASDMIDLMESALERVRTGLTRRLGRLGKGRSRASQEVRDEELDGIESFINSAQDDTVQVVSEINKGKTRDLHPSLL